MSIKRTYMIFVIVSIFLLAACGGTNKASSNNAENSTNDLNESNHTNTNIDGNEAEIEDVKYKEFGETFEIIGYYSDEPLDVTIHNVTIESKEEHREYIESTYSDLDETYGIALVEMTVVNKGDSDVGYADFVPMFTGVNDEIDITYPENDLLSEDIDAFAALSETLSAGEETHFTGAAILNDPALEYASVLTFNGHEVSEGPLLFAVPQSEHKTPVGTYSLEEEVFPIDRGESGGIGVTFHDIYVEDSFDELEEVGINEDEISYIAMDVTIENTTEETISYDDVIPSIRTEGLEDSTLSLGVQASRVVLKDGTAFWSYDEVINPGEKIEATLYAYVDKGKEDEAIISYFPYDMAFAENLAITIDSN